MASQSWAPTRFQFWQSKFSILAVKISKFYIPVYQKILKNSLIGRFIWFMGGLYLESSTFRNLQDIFMIFGQAKRLSECQFLIFQQFFSRFSTSNVGISYLAAFGTGPTMFLSQSNVSATRNYIDTLQELTGKIRIFFFRYKPHSNLLSFIYSDWQILSNIQWLVANSSILTIY